MPRKPTEFTESLIKSLLPEDKVYTQSERGLVMRVYPSGTKTWSYYKTAPDGTRKEHRLGNYPDISLKDARELSQTLAGEMIKKGMGIATNQKGVTFGEYMLSDKYLRWSRTNRPAHQSILDNLKNVIPTWIHRKQLKLFTNEDFEKFVEERLLGRGYDKKVKASTINRNLNNIRSVFRHAYDNRELDENPMDRFSNLTETQPKEKLSLTNDERKRLVMMARDRTLPQAETRRHMELFIELGLSTGMRNGELVWDAKNKSRGNKPTGLQWKHIKNDDMQTTELPFPTGNKLYQTVKNTVTELTIDNTKKASKLPVDIKYAEKGKIRWYVDIPGTFTKNNKNRKVGIPDHLVERIREYLWEREGELIKTKYKDALMHDENMNVIRADHTTAMNVFDEMPIIPFKYVDTSFNNLCDMAGLTDITIHSMRHDFCTQLVKKGTDIYTVQRLAGHADIRTTMRYVHALERKDFEALEDLHDFN
jgi:site-specific recombinase XerD